MKKMTSKRIISLLLFSSIFFLVILFAIGPFLKSKQPNQNFQETQQNSQLRDSTQNDADTNSVNLANTPTPNISPSIIPSSKTAIYSVPETRKSVTLPNGLKLCLPPNWEADEWGNVYYNRDSAYRPSVTYIQEIPYLGGSRRESFYSFWESEYPEVRQTVQASEVPINSDTALKFSGPESEKIVWFASGKLWQADISGWSWVNDSKTSFLKDFYTMISCSF